MALPMMHRSAAAVVMVMHHVMTYSLHTQGFYAVYSMVFELIRSEDEQFRDNSSDDEDDIPQFGQCTPDLVSVNKNICVTILVLKYLCVY